MNGTVACVGDADDLGSIENKHRAGLDDHPGECGRRRLLDRARPDRRHVDAQLLARLRALGQHPCTTARRRAAGELSHPLQHGVGAFCALDRQHLAVRHHHGLARVDGRQRMPHGEADLRIGAIGFSQTDAALTAGARQQIRRHIVDAKHHEAVALEEAHDACQYGIIATRQQAEDLRQAPKEADVGSDAPQVGPRNGAGDHQLPCALAPQGRHHAGARCFAGNFLFSTGPNSQGGGKRTTKGHYDVPMRDCTVELDGKVVIERGKIVDDRMRVQREQR